HRLAHLLFLQLALLLLLRRRPASQLLRDSGRGTTQLRVRLVVAADPLEQDDRLTLRRAVLEAERRQPPDGRVVVRRDERVQQRAHAVHGARMVAGQQLERQERRAARGRARVVEPASQELLLRTPAELPDRPERDGALAKVRAPRGALELVLPRRAQLREVALGARLRELVRLRRRFGERHAYTAAASRIAAAERSTSSDVVR